jgi:hypothetical protein
MHTQPSARQRKTRIGAGASPQPPKTEFIYHWNRIIGALVGLVLLIAMVVLVGFGIHAWLSSPYVPSVPSGDAASDEAATPVVQVEAAPASGEPETDEPARQPAEPEVGSGPVAPPRETIPATDTAMPSDGASLGELEVPAPSEAPDTTEEDLPRVFLPPDTRVNLRAAPALSSPVLRILDARAELRLLEIDEAFYRVRSAEGIVGWISRDFSSLTPYEPPGVGPSQFIVR